MAYNQSDPAYAPPRRAYTTDESRGHYAHGPAHRPGAPPQQQAYRGRGGQDMGGQYGVPRGEPAMRSQSQRRAPMSPQQSDPYGGYGHGGGAQGYSDPAYALEEEMYDLNISAPPAQGMGRGPPNQPPPGSAYARPPRPPGMGRAPPPQQRMPPPRMPLRGRGGGPLPPIRHHPQPPQEIVDDYGQYDYQYQEEPRPLQRSTTLPAEQKQPEQQQYTAYNPAMAAHYNVAPRQDQGWDQGYDAQWAPRESVGAFLDSYYTGGTESPLQPPADAEQYAPPQNGPVPRRNFSRPGPTRQYHSQDPADQYWTEGHADQNFGQQAHRSHSQPNLRHNGYDGMAEAPPVPAVPVNGYNGGMNGHGINGQMPIRRGSEASSHPSTSTKNADALPEHPDPASLRQAERHGSGESLPKHPTPVRPGLMQNDHPPPQRQYEQEDSSVVSAQSTEPQPVTKQELDQLTHAAKMNSGDAKLQLTLAKKLVEAASVLANEGGRADIKTTRKNRENYILSAHKIVKKLANSSRPYPEAIFYLASCYGDGQLGLAIDHEKAYHLYHSAAKLNHGPSAYRTAVCCELGAGVKRDPTKAMTWYKKAASLGETPAMFKLGMIQLKGLLGQPRDSRDGIIWLKRAAAQADENNPHALHELGLIHEESANRSEHNILPDEAYARELFMKAAELGYPASQFRMGCAYEYGTLGCPIDPRKSIAWYSKAAMKGDIESQLALSGWYLTGSEGIVQQSDTEAYLWARKAAEKGLAKAEYALGYFTEVGIGVPANVEEAKRWYYKAANQQHPKAMQRLQELKNGGASATRLSRNHAKDKEEGDCVIM